MLRVGFSAGAAAGATLAALRANGVVRPDSQQSPTIAELVRQARASDRATDSKRAVKRPLTSSGCGPEAAANTKLAELQGR